MENAFPRGPPLTKMQLVNLDRPKVVILESCENPGGIHALPLSVAPRVRVLVFAEARRVAP